jgi:hypothetical protein
LYFAAVTARAELQSAIQSLLAAAASKQPSVLQQVQGDLLQLLQLVVLPELLPAGGSASSAAVIKEPALSAVSRILKGECNRLQLTSEGDLVGCGVSLLQFSNYV